MRPARFNKLESLFFAMLVAAAVAGIVSLSGDPRYVFEEMLPGSNYRRFDAMIVEASRKHGVSPELVKAVVWRESRFDPSATGAAGERGLMQVTEIAAKDWAESTRLQTFVPEDLFDPVTNLDVGVWYLGRALTRYADRDDPLPFSLAEYNAGKSRVDRWGGGAGAAPLSAEEFRRRIDFPSTALYIRSILARKKFYEGRGEFDGKKEPPGGDAIQKP